MRLRHSFLLLMFAALPLRAGDIRFDPPNPSSHDAVTVWGYSICPASARGIVTRHGRSIVIDFPSLGGGCIATPSPFRVPVNLGVLEAGTYDVTVRLMGTETDRDTLEVRGVDPLPVYPAGAPTSGRGRVYIGKDYAFSGRDVRAVVFGSVEGRVLGPAGEWLVVEAPPQAPGIVDVTVVSRDERLVIPHSFKYYEGTEPDPFVYEPLLVPVHYNGPGANGSEWRSETWIGAAFFSSRPILFHVPPCSTCSEEVRELVKIDSARRDEGLILYVARGALADLAVSTRARDMSRRLSNSGTEIPVVGMEQFRRLVVLPNIAREREHRYMLRIWAERAPDDRPDVGITWSTGRLTNGTTVTLDRTADPRFFFRSIDVTSQIHSAPAGEPLTLYVGGGPVWALLTITNNETQHVTAVAPPARVR